MKLGVRTRTNNDRLVRSLHKLYCWKNKTCISITFTFSHMFSFFLFSTLFKFLFPQNYLFGLFVSVCKLLLMTTFAVSVTNDKILYCIGTSFTFSYWRHTGSSVDTPVLQLSLEIRFMQFCHKEVFWPDPPSWLLVLATFPLQTVLSWVVALEICC